MISVITSLRRYRHLVFELTKREFKDRYAQQALGTLWAWLHPLLLMALYTTIFNYIFAVRFGDRIDLPRDFTTYVLAGLVPWLAMQDVLGRSADTILAHVGFVKQMAFPVDVLPVKRALSSLPIFFTGTVFLVLYQLYAFGSLPWTVLLWPIYLAFLVIFAMGIVFLFGALGVFLRDLREVISVFCTANLFLMPILFIPGVTPWQLNLIFWLNPFSYMVWMHHDLLFYGRMAHPIAWVVFPALAVGCFMLGVSLFQRLRTSFGDEI